MTKETDVEKLYHEYNSSTASKNLLLARTCERLVLEGVLRADALELVLQMKGHECLVADGQITLDNVDLETAVRRMVAKMPLLAPPADYVNPDVERRKKLEEESKAGSVTSLGLLFKDYVDRLGPIAGEAQFKKWQAEQGVTTGKPATGINAALKAAEHALDHPDNPFLRLRKNGVVDKAVELEIGEITRTKGFSETARLAKEAGTNLSGHPLPQRRFG